MFMHNSSLKFSNQTVPFPGRNFASARRPTPSSRINPMRGMRLVLALLCLGLALPASAQSPYAGVYIGDVTDIPGTTDTGWFAVMVRDNGIAFAIFIDFTAFSDGASTDNITVKSDGSFAFDLPHPNPDVMQPGRKVVGTIAFGVISGDVCDFTLNSGDPGCPGSGGNNPLDAKFSAARSPSTGLFAQFGGIYAGMITGGGQESGVQVSADGPIVAIADATGQALVLASPRLTLGSTPQGVVDMAGLVQIDPAAGINYALSGGGQLFGTINFLLSPPIGQRHMERHRRQPKPFGHLDPGPCRRVTHWRARRGHRRHRHHRHIG